METFDCVHCGRSVEGDGYTNHCPDCLWSVHVDDAPGDRANPCGGAMEPVGLEQHRGRDAIVHRCTRCGTAKRNRTAAADRRDALVALAARAAERAARTGPASSR